MLTLITGLPGNGKTLYALQYVDAWAKREGRSVWYHGISNLAPELGWQALPTVTESVNGKAISDPKSTNIEVPQWWLCPAKSIILIDEAQNCGFGVRQRGVVPEWGQKLETHRHLGLDLVFITQDPGLIDSHDRKLMELHFHVMRTFGLQRATIHEFRPVRDNIKTRKGSIQHKWAFPRNVFGWYKSAEAHTHKARIPMRVWVLATIIIAVPLVGWFAWSHYLDPNRSRPGPVVPGQPAASPGPFAGPAAPQGKPVKTTAEYIAEQQPRVAGLAYTAPVYDEVTKPTQAPYPAACVSMASKGCKCYTQQGTLLATPADLCASIVAGGFFVAWQDKTQSSVIQAPTRPGRPAPVPVVSGSFGGMPLGAPAADYGGIEQAGTAARRSVAPRS